MAATAHEIQERKKNKNKNEPRKAKQIVMKKMKLEIQT